MQQHSSNRGPRGFRLTAADYLLVYVGGLVTVLTTYSLLPMPSVNEVVAVMQHVEATLQPLLVSLHKLLA